MGADVGVAILDGAGDGLGLAAGLLGLPGDLLALRIDLVLGLPELVGVSGEFFGVCFKAAGFLFQGLVHGLHTGLVFFV